MKLIKIKTLLILFILAGTACSKDDTSQQEKNLLIGKWRPTTEIATDGDIYTYDGSCNNVWTFTENSILAEWDDDCNGSIDDSYTASYALKNDRFDFLGVATDGEEYFLKSVTQNTLEINVVDISIPDEPEGYLMTFDRIN